jgi:hypothetical protein
MTLKYAGTEYFVTGMNTVTSITYIISFYHLYQEIKLRRFDNSLYCLIQLTVDITQTTEKNKYFLVNIVLSFVAATCTLLT